MKLERAGLARFGGASKGASGRILCYHSVGTPAWGVNDVNPRTFLSHLELALAAGYKFVTAEQVASGAAGPMDLAITFDDGLSSVALNAAPALAELRLPWTMFVVTDWAEGKHRFGPDVLLRWKEIERLAWEGATIGSHSVSHRNFRTLSAEEAMLELDGSAALIGQRLGIRPILFAIPFGGRRDWTEEGRRAAAEAGYRYVFAQAEDRRPVGTIGRTFITRFDASRNFAAALRGAFAGWEEWS